VALTDDISDWFWYAGKTDPVGTSAYEGGKLYFVSAGPPGTGPWSEGNTMADFEFKTYVAPPPPPGTGGGSGGGGPGAASATGQRAAALKKCKKKRSQKAKRKCRKKAKKKPV
jgi:hypothetical protein